MALTREIIEDKVIICLIRIQNSCKIPTLEDVSLHIVKFTISNLSIQLILGKITEHGVNIKHKI